MFSITCWINEIQEKVYAPCAGVLWNYQQVQHTNPNQCWKPSRKPCHRESRQPSRHSDKKQSKGRAQESTAWNNGEELPQCKISQLASAWNHSKQERSEEQEVWAQTRRPSVVVEVVAWPGVRDYNRLRRPPNVHPYGEHMKWHHSDLLFTLLRADQWVRV